VGREGPDEPGPAAGVAVVGTLAPVVLGLHVPHALVSPRAHAGFTVFRALQRMFMCGEERGGEGRGGISRAGSPERVVACYGCDLLRELGRPQGVVLRYTAPQRYSPHGRRLDAAAVECASIGPPNCTTL
jgi:hypothetical protein